jgi:hypothetical protein
MKNKEKNNEIQINNQFELRELEQMYVENKIDTMFETIEKKKEELVNDMVDYAEKHTKACKWDKDGVPLDYTVEINPLVINNYFFKSIVPITSQEPQYNAEKLGMVFDYYCEILAEVNDRIGNFPSSLTSFCKLAGITLQTLRNYRNSSDYGLRVVAEKIYDQIGDENITMSQMGVVRERSTIFKMKSQNEIVEKEQPKVSINITEKPNMERIEERINKYKMFAKKKVVKNGK